MKLSDPEKLAQYVLSLPSFEFYKTIDGNYDHIGANVADAVLQANNNYKTNVKPRVNRIMALYRAARTTSSVLRLLESIAATEFLNWRGPDRAERFTQILNLFAAEGIEVEADLRDWLSHDSNLPKLRSIKGIGPKTIDYFKILVGVSTCAIDRHLLAFLGLAGLPAYDYLDAQLVINSTAEILSVDRACFDHSIWQFMSKRAAASQTGSVELKILDVQFLRTVFSDDFIFSEQPHIYLEQNPKLTRKQRNLALEIHASDLYPKEIGKIVELIDSLSTTFLWQNNSEGALLFVGKILFLLDRYSLDAAWFIDAWGPVNLNYKRLY